MPGLPVAAIGSDTGRPYPDGWQRPSWGIDDVTQAAVRAAAGAAPTGAIR